MSAYVAVAVTAAAALENSAAGATAPVLERSAVEALDPTTEIDFESNGLGESISLSTPHDYRPLDADEYAPLGVRFTTDLNVIHPDFQPFRFAQFVQGATESMDAAIGWNAIPSVQVDGFGIVFDAPVRTFGLMFATLRADESGTYAAPTFEVFGVGGELLAAVTISETSPFVDDTLAFGSIEVDHGFVGFTSSTLIGRVEITKDEAIFDDLIFSPIQIPAPTAATTVGLLGLGLLRRTRR